MLTTCQPKRQSRTIRYQRFVRVAFLFLFFFKRFFVSRSRGWWLWGLLICCYPRHRKCLCGICTLFFHLRLFDDNNNNKKNVSYVFVFLRCCLPSLLLLFHPVLSSLHFDEEAQKSSDCNGLAHIHTHTQKKKKQRLRRREKPSFFRTSTHARVL